MLKSLIAALAISGALATASFAAETPKDRDECFTLSFDLAKAVEKANLPKDKLEKIEALLTKLDTNCDSDQFAEAVTVSTEVEGIIAGK